MRINNLQDIEIILVLKEKLTIIFSKLTQGELAMLADMMEESSELFYDIMSKVIDEAETLEGEIEEESDLYENKEVEPYEFVDWETLKEESRRIREEHGKYGNHKGGNCGDL